LANSFLELKDTKSARKALEDLVRNYPQSEAAQSAAVRLQTLK
jgi:TolA-binding protein